MAKSSFISHCDSLNETGFFCESNLRENYPSKSDRCVKSVRFRSYNGP